MRILITSALLASALSACAPSDPETLIRPITCKLAGVTILEGYANRMGVVRQPYRKAGDAETRTVFIPPGTECVFGDRLKRSEVDELFQ